MGLSFRPLRADEIECRVGQIARNGSGLSLLLYKTSRVDCDILDEVVGPENWQCDYSVVNGELFCTVSIWSDERGQWVSKQDVGSPSNMEAEKGRSSDAFKRACFRWGIGRELYTAPRIWVYGSDCYIRQSSNGRLQCRDTFSVTSIAIEDREIKGVSIRNDRTGKIVFSCPNEQGIPEVDSEPSPEQLVEITELIDRLSEVRGVSNDDVLRGLMNSHAMKNAGVEDGRIATATQAAVAIGQLKFWIEGVSNA